MLYRPMQDPPSLSRQRCGSEVHPEFVHLLAVLPEEPSDQRGHQWAGLAQIGRERNLKYWILNEAQLVRGQEEEGSAQGQVGLLQLALVRVPGEVVAEPDVQIMCPSLLELQCNDMHD